MNEGFFSVVYRISERVMFLAYINLLWLLFTVAGLGVLGIFPATAAVFAVTRQQIKNDKSPGFKMFFSYFKQDFWKANMSGWLLVPFGYLIYVNINLVSLLEGSLAVIMFFGMILIGALYLLFVFYFFPVFVHYNLKIRNYFALSVIFVFSHPVHTILIGTASVLHLLLIYHIPALIPFIGISLWGFLVTHICQNAFQKPRPSAPV